MFFFIYLFIFYRRAEKEQAVSAALTDGRQPACSISLSQMSMLYMCAVFSLS